MNVLPMDASASILAISKRSPVPGLKSRDAPTPASSGFALLAAFPLLARRAFKDSSLRSFLTKARELDMLDMRHYKRSPPPEFRLRRGEASLRARRLPRPDDCHAR